MAGRSPPRDPDPDDWFGRGSAQSAPGGTASASSSIAGPEETGTAEDWLDAESAGAPRRGLPENPSRRTVLMAAAVAVAVVVLVAGLAVGGVFSGGGTSDATTAATETTAPASTVTPSTSTSTTPAAAAPVVPTAPLQPGDQGVQVKRLQRALVRLGYPTGAVDGDYGPSTTGAVTRFQRASGLAADGVLGPKTLAALKQAR